jgi:hypothetical protein
MQKCALLLISLIVPGIQLVNSACIPENCNERGVCIEGACFCIDGFIIFNKIFPLTFSRFKSTFGNGTDCALSIVTVFMLAQINLAPAKANYSLFLFMQIFSASQYFILGIYSTIRMIQFYRKPKFAVSTLSNTEFITYFLTFVIGFGKIDLWVVFLISSEVLE